MKGAIQARWARSTDKKQRRVSFGLFRSELCGRGAYPPLFCQSPSAGLPSTTSTAPSPASHRAIKTDLGTITTGPSPHTRTRACRLRQTADDAMNRRRISSTKVSRWTDPQLVDDSGRGLPPLVLEKTSVRPALRSIDGSAHVPPNTLSALALALHQPTMKRKKRSKTKRKRSRFNVLGEGCAAIF